MRGDGLLGLRRAGFDVVDGHGNQLEPGFPPHEELLEYLRRTIAEHHPEDGLAPLGLPDLRLVQRCTSVQQGDPSR